MIPAIATTQYAQYPRKRTHYLAAAIVHLALSAPPISEQGGEAADPGGRTHPHAAASTRLAGSYRSLMGRASNCVGAWSYLRRAGTPRSLLSPPGEALWPSGPMDHGVQRRERGGGQASGPAARPELAAPSAAAVPREIPTCSASLLFRFSGRKPPPATGSSFARLLRCVQRPAGQRLCSSRAAVSPHYPQYGAIITTPARLSLLTLLSLSSRGGQIGADTRPANAPSCRRLRGVSGVFGGAWLKTNCSGNPLTPGARAVPLAGCAPGEPVVATARGLAGWRRQGRRDGGQAVPACPADAKNARLIWPWSSGQRRCVPLLALLM
jgi:hypothetical protein